MIPYVFDMPPKTHATLLGWSEKWALILEVPGCVLLTAAVRTPCTEVFKETEIVRFITLAASGLRKFEIKRSVARANLLWLTEDEIYALIWVFGNARTGHGRQDKAARRLSDVLLRFRNRSPLIRLAECAE